MNPKIADVAKRYMSADSATERMHALEPLRELAGETDPLTFLMSEIDKGIEGHLCITGGQTKLKGGLHRGTDLQISIDGMRVQGCRALTFRAEVSGVPRVELDLYVPSVEIDGNFLCNLSKS